MYQFFSSINNEIGFVFLAKEKWHIIDSTHASERAVERLIGIDNVNLAIAMLVDQLDASPKMLAHVMQASRHSFPIRFRDDVNDLTIVVSFNIPKHTLSIITCWNQALDRQMYGKAHTAYGKGFNIHAEQHQVRFICRYNNGECKTFSRDENWEISRIEGMDDFIPTF